METKKINIVRILGNYGMYIAFAILIIAFMVIS